MPKVSGTENQNWKPALAMASSEKPVATKRPAPSSRHSA